MQSKATENSSINNISKRQSHAHTFAKVFDGNKQPIRGLWVRNDRYYAQLTIEDNQTGLKKVRRVRLDNKDGSPVKSAAEAKAVMERLRTQRADNALPALRQTPKLTDYVIEYIASIEGKKKSGTISKEESTLERWIEFFRESGFGEIRLDQIRRVHVNGFLEKRLKDKFTPRTANLDVIALRNVLNRAIQNGLIQRLPTEGMRPLKTTSKKRSLFTTADLDKFCETAFSTKRNEDGKEVPLTKNAQELV